MALGLVASDTNHNMHPADLGIRDGAVSRLLFDAALAGVWEHLRRSGRPTTGTDVAATLGIPDADAMNHLDRLVELGFARRLPMTSRRRSIRFQAMHNQLIVRYRMPEDGKILQDMMDSRLAHTHSAMPTEHEIDSSFGFVMYLAESEAQEVCRLLGSIASLLNDCASRKPSWRDGLRPPNYAVSLRLAPVTVPAMPTPILQFVPEGSEAMPTVRTAATSHGRDLLSPRERQIGAAYLRGLTRKEIAAELGLSENSVATFTKRLYTKLGIRRRGALAGRLAEILGGATAQ